MIYLFDTYKHLIYTIKKSQLSDARYTQEINGLYTFDAELPIIFLEKDNTVINHKNMFDESSYVGHFDIDGNFQMYKLYNVKVDGDMLAVKGVHIFFDEAKSLAVIEDIRLVDTDARGMFNTVFQDTGWSVKNYDTTPYLSQDFYKVVPSEARATIIDLFKVEIHPYLVFDGQKITHKYVDIRLKLGNETAQRFAYGHNAFNVTHEQNKADIYTAIIGRGATNGLSNALETRIEFHNISWSKASGNPADKPKGSNILHLPERTQEYGHVLPDGTLRPRIGYIVFEEIGDAQVLLEETYKWLNENSRPKFIAESTVEQIGESRLGDRINFIYKKIDLYFSVRIFKVENNLLDPTATVVELGDYDFFNTDKAAARIEGQIAQIKNDAKGWLYQQQLKFDNEFNAMKSEMEENFNQAELEAEQRVLAAETRLTGEITAQHDALQGEIDEAYSNAVTEADKKVAEAEARLSSEIDSQHDALQADISDSYNKAVSDAQAKVDAAESEMNALINANKAEADSKMSSFNTQLGDATSQINAIDAQVDSVVGDLNNYRTATDARLNAADAKFTSYDTKFTDINAQLTPIKNDILKNTSDITSVKNSVAGQSADITNLNNQIKLTATKTEVTDAVNAISVGGRNYLLDSRNLATSPNDKGLGRAVRNADGSWTVTPDAGKSVSQYLFFTIARISIGRLPIGKTCVFSMDVTASVNTKITNYVSNTIYTAKSFDLIAGKKTRIYSTFIPNDDTKNPTLVFMTNTNDAVISYDNMKVEIGSVPTDWTPAPEDVDARITKNTADITVANNEIAKRVLKTDYDLKTGQMQTQINTAISTADKNTQTIAVINGDLDKVEQWQIDKGTTIEQTADAITNKVWNTDIDSKTGAITEKLNTVSNTVDSNTATILQHTTRLDGIDTWQQEKGSTIQQTSDAISQKIWQTDINSATGAIDAKVNSVKSTVDSNSATILQHTNSINNLSQKQTEQGTAITQTQNAISTKVWQTDITSAVNGLDINTRNYQPNITKGFSAGSAQLPSNNGIDTLNILYKASSTTPYVFLQKIIPLEVSATYTISFYVTLTSPTDVSYTYRYGIRNGVFADKTITLSPNVRQKVSYTFTAGAPQGQFILYPSAPVAVDHAVTLEKVMLVKGNKATDWTPAPEDVESRITKAEADIIINKGEIIKRVTLSDYNTKTGELTTSINNVKSTADANTAKITTQTSRIDGLVSWTNDKGSIIDQTNNAITQKVWNTDINNATGTLQTQINTVKSTADSNTSTITSVKSTVDGLQSWQNAKGSQIDQTINAVSTKVWQNDIDAIQIGGRNLLLDSRNRKALPNNTGTGTATQNSDKSWTITPEAGKLITVYIILSGNMSISKFESNKSYVLGFDVTVDKDCTLTKYVFNTLYSSPPAVLKAGVRQRVYVNFKGQDLSPSYLIMNLSTADTKLIYDNIKVEEGTKGTSWTPAPEDAENKMTEIAATADAAKVQANAIGADYVKQSAVVVQADGVMIGSKKVSGTEMASAISVTPSNVDIITKVMRVTGDMAVAGDIKSLSLSAVYADIANLRANIITADSITATALKVDSALMDKLNANSILTNKLIADTAMINAIKSNSITAVRGDIAYLKSNIITADSIDATALKVDTALIDKLNANSILTNKLIADTAFVNNIKAKSLEAVYADIAKLRTNVLIADAVTASALKVDQALIDKLLVNDLLANSITAKAAFISNVKAIDVDLNRATARGSVGTNYLQLTADELTQYGTYSRTWQGSTQTQNVFARLKGGHLRFRNNTLDRSLYYSDFGISTYVDGDGNSDASGTLEFFDYYYSSNARGVTLNSVGGVVALRSDNNRVVIDSYTSTNIESKTASVYIRPMVTSRVGTNEFQFAVKDNATASDTDGTLTYGSITSGSSYGSGIRFDKSSSTTYVYATDNTGSIGTGDFYARNLLGDWKTKSDNLYAMVNGSNDGKLRITDRNGYNNGSPTYMNLQCRDIQANSIRVNGGDNLYLGTSTGEVRVTNNLLYNNGSPGYQDIRFKTYYSTSSEKYKADISEWDYSVLDVFRHDLKMYQFKFKSELETDYARYHHGVIIERETPIEWVHGDGVDQYEAGMWNTKAIQELIFENDERKKENESLKTELSDMKQQLNYLMEKVG